MQISNCLGPETGQAGVGGGCYCKEACEVMETVAILTALVVKCVYAHHL